MARESIYKISGMNISASDVDIRIETEGGVFHIGVDNDGYTYVATGRGTLSLHPSASNRVRIREEK